MLATIPVDSLINQITGQIEGDNHMPHLFIIRPEPTRAGAAGGFMGGCLGSMRSFSTKRYRLVFLCSFDGSEAVCGPKVS